ncbi:MAG TPA: nucleotide exchange factor GrpE [Thermomicrobiales bacterium]|nr:nucleotide exchange factor GrpE [Thermomicrobiales bacterium]
MEGPPLVTQQQEADQMDETELNDQPEGQPSMEEVLAELEQFKADAADMLDRLQRSHAEFANFRRRIEQERELQRSRATEDLVRKLLPVADDFDRALRSVPDEIEGNPWIEGIRLVERKLWRALEGEGISLMESLGQPFDPSRHEAVMVDEGDGVANTVVEEFQRGYLVNDTVLRPAMVKVGSSETLNLTTTAMDA